MCASRPRSTGSKAALAAALLAACALGCTSSTANPLTVSPPDGGTPPIGGQPPVVDSFVVAATAVQTGDTVALSTTAHAPGGDAVAYLWSQRCTGGGDGTIAAPTSAATTWTATAAGACTLEVQVTAQAHTVTRTAEVTIAAVAPIDHAPVIDAVTIPSTTALVGDALSLSVTAHDPDGDPTAYSWSQTCTGGGNGTFASPAAAATTWTATAAGACTLQILVTANALTAARTADVTIAAVAPVDHAPVIDALTVPGTAVHVGDALAVSVAAHDPDGDALAYLWSQTCTGGGSGAFAKATAAATTWTASAAGVCTLKMRVTAKTLTATQTAAVTIAAVAPIDHAPVIDALTIPGSAVHVGDALAVSVTAHDPDGDALAYLWSQTCTGGAGGTFAAPSAAATTWTATAAGVCTLEVQVTAKGLTATQTGDVTIAAAVPIAVTVTPGTAQVDACKSVTLSAAVTGTSNQAVAWSVVGGAAGGTVTAAGVYTAPPTAGTYSVTATSQADGTKSNSAVMTVAERVLAVAVSPATVPNLAPGGTATFTATVTTTCGSFASTSSVTAPAAAAP